MRPEEKIIKGVLCYREDDDWIPYTPEQLTAIIKFLRADTWYCVEEE